MTPKDAPSVERISIVLRQWSHYETVSSCFQKAPTMLVFGILRAFSFKRASLIGLCGRESAGGVAGLVGEVESAIVVDLLDLCVN